MYLLPYDGAPELLEETTISREKLFTEVAAANPEALLYFWILDCSAKLAMKRC